MCSARSRFASSMNGLFSSSVSNFHSAPSRLLISELCILGFSCVKTTKLWGSFCESARSGCGPWPTLSWGRRWFQFPTKSERTFLRLQCKSRQVTERSCPLQLEWIQFTVYCWDFFLYSFKMFCAAKTSQRFSFFSRAISQLIPARQTWQDNSVKNSSNSLWKGIHELFCDARIHLLYSETILCVRASLVFHFEFCESQKSCFPEHATVNDAVGFLKQNPRSCSCFVVLKTKHTRNCSQSFRSKFIEKRLVVLKLRANRQWGSNIPRLV